MEIKSKGIKRPKLRGKIPVKEYAYTSAERANFEAMKAREVFISMLPFLKLMAFSLIKVEGRVLRLPGWFNYVPSN
jgi:hypothetical protein